MQFPTNITLKLLRYVPTVLKGQIPHLSAVSQNTDPFLHQVNRRRKKMYAFQPINDTAYFEELRKCIINVRLHLPDRSSRYRRRQIVCAQLKIAILTKQNYQRQRKFLLNAYRLD